MTKHQFKLLLPGFMGKQVQVTNARYLNGGYQGTIIGCMSDGYGDDKLLIKHPIGSDGWESIKDCELID